MFSGKATTCELAIKIYFSAEFAFQAIEIAVQ